MNEVKVYVFHIDAPEGGKDYVSLIPPAKAFSRGLPREAIAGTLLRPLAPGEPISPEVFASNPVFVQFLHEIVARESPNQPNCCKAAIDLGEGWLYVVDQRTATPQGAVPPEDILGAFQVKEGEIVPGSYRPNANHAILSTSGFFQLDVAMHQCLLRELEARSEKQ
jgi:hypothetical protein